MAALAQWTNAGMIDNSVNEMEVHIQQTNDRLQCIRQVADVAISLAMSHKKWHFVFGANFANCQIIFYC